jgi:general secretion pathway protein B
VEAKPQDRRILKLNELPRAVRNGLPEFRISGHAYSPEPQTRVARVNEKILQEGQELTPGLKLEEIIPSGLIFSYQGYRFRVTISENR